MTRRFWLHVLQIDDTKAELLQNIANDVVFNNLKKWNLKNNENIGENNHKNKFRIINDPFNDLITIENLDNTSYDIKVFNINGVIINEANSNSNVTLNTNNAQGVLIIKLTDNKRNTFTKKIIKC